MIYMSIVVLIVLWPRINDPAHFHTKTFEVKLTTDDKRQNELWEDWLVRNKKNRMAVQAPVSDLTGKICHAWHQSITASPNTWKRTGKGTPRRQSMIGKIPDAWQLKVEKTKAHTLEAKTWTDGPKLMRMVFN